MSNNNTIIKNLVDFLLTVSDLTDIVETRIRPAVVHQKNNSKPYVIIEQLQSDDDQELSGVTDFVKTTLDIQAITLSFEAADDIAEVIRLNIHGYQQRIMGNLYINSIIKTNEFTFEDAPQTGNNKWIYTRSLIYDISYPIPDNVAHP